MTRPIIRKKRPSKPREYDNRQRSQKSNNNRELIIETLVEILVERNGGDPTFAEIAERAKLAERTIYRFFKDKKELHNALNKYLFSYLQTAFANMDETTIAGFGRYAFDLFERNQSLTKAYILSPFGETARRLFRKKLNEALVAKILKEKPMELTPERERRIGVVVGLVSAKIWHDLREDFNFTGKEMGDTIAWALETLIKAL